MSVIRVKRNISLQVARHRTQIERIGRIYADF
jgi:hypothetical protein